MHHKWRSEDWECSLCQCSALIYTWMLKCQDASFPLRNNGSSILRYYCITHVELTKVYLCVCWFQAIKNKQIYIYKITISQSSFYTSWLQPIKHTFSLHMPINYIEYSDNRCRVFPLSFRKLRFFSIRFLTADVVVYGFISFPLWQV